MNRLRKMEPANPRYCVDAEHSAFRIPHCGLGNEVPPPPPQPFILPAFRAFTIIELLVAMAVLTMILVLMVQVVDGIMKSTRTQTQQMDSIAAARRTLDTMLTDIQSGVIGESSTILAPSITSSNLFALLTTRRGMSSAPNHRFLSVTYSTNTSNQIVRSYGSVNFAQPNLLAAATNATAGSALASGVLAVQIRAFADGTNSYPITNSTTANWATNVYNGLPVPTGYQALLTQSPTFSGSLTNKVRAVEIWIAAVDAQNYQLLSDAGNLSAVQSLLAGDPSTWRSAIDSAAIPGQTKLGIRILNKSTSLR